jgi:hypothetical protein
MSTQNNLPGQGKLPLPSPRSPAELDERIINAARERAPYPRSQRQPWWMAGAATTCLLIVAVLLVQPEQPPVTHSESMLSSAPKASKTRALKNTSDDSIQKLELRQYSEKDSKAAMETGVSVQSPSQATEAAVERSYDFMAEEMDGSTSPNRNIAIWDDAATLEPNNASAVPKGSELYQRIEVLADLIKNGNEDIAIEAYEKLKQEYSDGRLPKTLDEALKEYQSRKIR